ncbi:NrfD/PsrC family molybdoenzyme membrane anchor subunit [Streptomyces marincola]|uniref:NrfD/PsrC family molybdoenzyme membrane anchor subunit n=1 Tax=Streptomyces marincola TaxID=2878388 RepID=UPI001CF1C670|nr:NrfD/PsrC family molybdoenzyme membrane anchor subunit [Streptomyces marincola]UCM89435.1 polysulfide reductase NrfD [Streptomyces marincola]
MSDAEVTRAGLRNERPGSHALFGNGMPGGPGAVPDGAPPDGQRPYGADAFSTGTGSGERRAAGPAGRRRSRGGPGGGPGDGEAFTSYYGRPVLKAPHWAATDIAGYLFLGGLAGAGSVLAAGAELTGRRATARAMKLSSLGAVSLSVVALVHDLGRPARFLNMLRVIKPTSPMSIGSWLLAGYGPLAGVAAVTDTTGLFPRTGRAATCGAAVFGPAVAAYTGVLFADTAVPAWHEGHRELPYLFTGSAAAAAAGMALLAAPGRESGPARRAAVLGTAAEFAAMRALHRRAGPVDETYRRGKAGRLLRAASVLGAAGAAGAAGLAGRSRAAAALSGAALLAASACTRFGLFHAGLASVRDPKYTVEPQRARLAAAEAHAAAEAAETP